jgi:hypothetical protein
MLLRLAIDDLKEESAELFVVSSLTHRRLNIELQMASQARSKFPVAGKP